MKKIIRDILALSFVLITSSSFSQKNNLGKIIQEKSQLIQVQSGFSFTEGPATAPDGRIYFTDQPNNKIYIWNDNDEIKEFEIDGERSNGLYFSNEGQLIACADFRNKLLKIDMSGKKKVLADGYKGKHLNGPNDVWQAPNGNIYFTDSYYHRPWWPEEQKQEQDQRAVYCLTAEGKLFRVAEDYKMPNGIIGSPDGKILYVADINAGKTWKYEIHSEGKLSNKTLFASEGSDGMTIDNKGNVYLTNKAVSIFNKKGTKIGEIEIPERPANICFGGKKRNILFITARKSVYKIRTKVKGVK